MVRDSALRCPDAAARRPDLEDAIASYLVRAFCCRYRARHSLGVITNCERRPAHNSASYLSSQQVPSHLPEGEGVGGSLPDSIIVGRIGPIPSGLVLRDFKWRDGLLCSIGVSLFTGLGVSGTIGLGAGALSTSGGRVFVECEADPSFKPS